MPSLPTPNEVSEPFKGGGVRCFEHESKSHFFAQKKLCERFRKVRNPS